MRACLPKKQTAFSIAFAIARRNLACAEHELQGVYRKIAQGFLFRFDVCVKGVAGFFVESFRQVETHERKAFVIKQFAYEYAGKIESGVGYHGEQIAG